jgi:pantoate--beta-alanine ligase
VSGETRVVVSRASLRAAYDALPAGTRRAVVTTMGSLHEGHATLVREARALVGHEGHVTVTIFVNPTQFGPSEDLARYPRSLENDVDVCAHEGADLVWAPTPEVVYRDTGNGVVTVDPGPLGTVLEGAVRPGHFRGVLTVVHKLISLTGADHAMFGEKDFQQLVLVRRMVRDLDVDCEIVGVPTVRAKDGLALSSRNAYLSPAERHLALVVPQSIEVGRTIARTGGDAVDVVRAVQQFLDDHDVVTDYATVTDPELGPSPVQGEARLLVAVRVGDVRLIDNDRLDLGAPA